MILVSSNYNGRASLDLHQRFVNINILLNCVVVLFPKWSLIGRMLELPVGVINGIADEHKKYNYSRERDYQAACCTSMLIEWLRINEYATCHDFIKVMEYPSVGFSKDEIMTLHYIIDCGYKHTLPDLGSLPVPVSKPPRAPTEEETEFMEMMFDVIQLLCESSIPFDQALKKLFLLPRIPSSLLQTVTDWETLIHGFHKANFITLSDVDWLVFVARNIAKCSKAVERIENFKEKIQNYLLVDKICWESSPSTANNGVIQTKTNKTPQTVTCHDIDRSKNITADLFQLESTELLPNSATVSSITYNWKVSVDVALALKFPSSVSQELKSACVETGIVQIIIMAEGRNETIHMQQFISEESMYVIW